MRGRAKNTLIRNLYIMVCKMAGIELPPPPHILKKYIKEKEKKKDGEKK